HHKPDGDAIGSALGLYHFLIQLEHQVAVITPNEVPEYLRWLPGMEDCINFETEPKRAKDLMTQARFIFCLDFNDFSRTKDLKPILEESSALKVLIDHHLQPQDTFAYGISVPGKSSTCEMVYDFINDMGENEKINSAVSQCLFTGLLTDTGSFKFPTATASVHEMAADLQRKGLDHVPIFEKLFDNGSENRLRFLGHVLSQRMDILPTLKTGIIQVTQGDLQKFKVDSGDMEGLVNYPLSIGAVKLSVMITDRKEERRLSFRSKGNFDVSKIAREHFSGGGHFNAAGGKSTDSLEKTLT